jgi:hypothetical protein
MRRESAKEVCGMLRRFAPNLCLVLVAGLTATLLLSGPAQSADEKTKQQFENWAKSINAQNPAIGIDARTNYAVTGYARSPYQVTRPVTRPVGYRALLISPGDGGVIVGRDPEPIGRGAVEPIGLPKFEYKLLPEVKGQPRRVNLRFWLAKDVKNEKPSWEFEVSAAVITPMTAAALDGRLGLFTLTAVDEKGEPVGDGAAIHPALQGHRLAYRPAVLDLFAEETDGDKERMSDGTLKELSKQRVKNITLKSYPLSAVVERSWKLDESGLKAVDVGNDPSKASFKFVHRLVYESGKGDYEELAISDQVNKDVFASLTDTEKRLVNEYNEAVVVHRIVYWVKQGKIVNFDRDQNWSKLIDDLGDIYKANLDKSIDATELADAAEEWAEKYSGKDREMPAKMKLK